MRYRFILEDDDVDIDQPTGVQCSGRHIEHVITGEQRWEELLPYMMDWLKGCGYIFNSNERLDIVTDHPYTNEELLGGIRQVGGPTDDD